MKFTKMCASGNDFIVIDNRSGSYPDGTALAHKLCRRSYSVGADGLLFIENGNSGKLKMRIFNPDGSEAEMCGNGARCIAAFCYREKIANRKVNFETLAGLVEAEIIESESCRGSIYRTRTTGVINVAPTIDQGGNSYEVKLKMCNPSGIDLSFDMIIDGEKYMMSFINTGVPHTVLIMESIKNVDVKLLGRKIRYHKKFQPEGTNVDFVEVLDRERIRLRTYERGVEGETLACGTGAAASALVCHLLGKANSPVSVETGGGSTLKVHFKEDGEISDVYLQGDASFVYEGTLSSSKV